MSQQPAVPSSPELAQAVRELVKPGAVVGIGGQNIGRCAVATAVEIMRQGIGDLTLVGCNLSLHADLLVGANLVRRLECGTANLELYGVTHRIARAIEEARVQVEDYDHLSMLARFVAAGWGLPFLPIAHLDGTDQLRSKQPHGEAKFGTVANPWAPDQDVRLVPALHPDVTIVHAHAADAEGNVLIEGPASHDPELIRASRTVLVTVESILTEHRFDEATPGTVIPSAFITSLVAMPGGAFPTAVHGKYAHDHDAIEAYQTLAKSGLKPYDAYLADVDSLFNSSS